MADIYLQSIKEIERRCKDSVLIFSDVLGQRLDELAGAMVESRMSDNDDIELCKIYYQRYLKEENRTGMIFCLLRIQQLLQFKRKKRFQSFFPSLSFSSYCDSELKSFLVNKRYYYKVYLDAFKEKLIVLDMLFCIGFMYLFVLVFHFSFAWILCLVTGLGILIYVVGVYFYFDRYLEQIMEKMRNKIDFNHAKVDESIQRNQ